ncbi:S-adenosyl-L-methionine-dependent methyltransferase [Hypoxylon trugodes]|uniref:S-adenosyl-L-methionine-dependent methyltransferase n=1 Tax=Hypoxylon trugodes TaxID=326681 RepID=UPI0021A0D232|nr:S-adenosyl-L-methionine-dependent methyltransferase [Hypoxylon trugodes]KAI1388565.1 S-adenosyl-L-methionine-dependent methyltransferase [Hypoxylon trugodes]
MSNYNIVSVEEENKRLEQGLELTRAYIPDGKVFLAPVDTSRDGLKVLDSAASYWLSQFQASLKNPDSATLIGTDLQDRFPNPPRPGIQLQTQDITKPWPESWKSDFDYVHQSLVLFQARPKLSEVVNSIAELVKPGGWIELTEPQPDDSGSEGPVFTQFINTMRELWTLKGTPKDYASNLEGIIKDAGFVDVKSILLPVGMGAKFKKPELADASAENMVAGAKNIPITVKLIPGGVKSIPAEELEGWTERLEAELKSKGAIFPLRVVYGRKPDA